MRHHGRPRKASQTRIHTLQVEEVELQCPLSQRVPILRLSCRLSILRQLYQRFLVPKKATQQMIFQVVKRMRIYKFRIHTLACIMRWPLNSRFCSSVSLPALENHFWRCKVKQPISSSLFLGDKFQTSSGKDLSQGM